MQGDFDPAIFLRSESAGTKTFSLTSNPPIFVAGSGAWLIARDGRRYLDFASGSGTCNVGHGNPEVLAAVRAQLDTGITHIGPHFHTTSQASLFDEILRFLPPGLTRLHPATNGTEATEVALKVCMHYRRARTFVAFTGGYHGRTFGALAVSDAKGVNASLAPFTPEVEFSDYPASGSEASAIDLAVRSISRRPATAPPLAGVIVEPIQATAGVIIPPPGFLQAIAEAASQAEIPLVLDEIFTGFGRTGQRFACERSGVVPDLLLMAKSLGGGFPGGLVAGREALLAGWPAGAQSSTFQLHPVTAAAGVAAIRFLQAHNPCARACQIGDVMERHRSILESCAHVREFRGLGAMWGLEVRGRSEGERRKFCRAVRLAALDKGLITWECGMEGEVIGLIPPLVVTDAEIEQACDILAKAIHAVLDRR